MNVSAINCTPIKPKVSFGNGADDFSDAQKVLDLSKQLNDNFQKGDDPEHKSPIQTAISVAGALATTFVLGKVAASKIITAFPNLLSKAGQGARKVAEKAKTVKVPNFVKNIKFPEKVQAGLNKVANNPVVKSVSEKATKFAGEAATKAANYVKTQSPEKLFTNGAGIASMLALGGQIAKVDGNKDGISDIAQENVNAYRSMAQNAGIFTEIVEALS